MTIIDIDRTKLYGLTHSLNDKPITRQVRMMKVAIGYPRAKAIHAYKASDDPEKWCVEIGSGKDIKTWDFASMEEARAFYDKNRKGAPERKYPSKFGYFTFLRIGPDGEYYPDWETIARHRAFPRAIDIVFITDSPLEQSMQWWTASRLLCEGNGKDARRRVDHGLRENASPQEKQAAQQARDAGSEWFNIIGQCYTAGCPFATGEKPVCKPHSRLSFQLAYAPTIGGTCVFDTTGWRSGANLFACLDQIRTITGSGNPDAGLVAGIPMRLILQPYKVRPHGLAPSTQYAVALQISAKDAVTLHRRVLTQADEFHRVLREPLMIEASHEEERLTESQEAHLMEAEFYPATEEQSEDWDDFQPAATEPQQEPLKQPRRKSTNAGPAAGGKGGADSKGEVNGPSAGAPGPADFEAPMREAITPNARGKLFAAIKSELAQQTGNDFEFDCAMQSCGINDKKQLVVDAATSNKLYGQLAYRLAVLKRAMEGGE